MSEEPASVDFDRAAEFYDATRGLNDETTERTLDLLTQEVAGWGRVLEIGVGTGLMALPLAERGVNMVGLDLSEQMLGQLVRKAGGRPPFPLLRADATRLPLRDGGFDAAYARHVLHLIPNWRLAVQELCRVVGRGVVLIEAGWSGGQDGWSSLWDAVRAAAGPAVEHVGLQMSSEGRAELDGAFIEAGGRPRELPEIPYEDHDTVERFVSEIERRSPSWTWRATDEEVTAAVDAARRWAMERFGMLDVRPDTTAHVRWRAFDIDR